MTKIVKWAPTVLAAAIWTINIAWAQQQTQTQRPGENQEPFTIESLSLGMNAKTPESHGMSRPMGFHRKVWYAHTDHGTRIYAIPGTDPEKIEVIRVIYELYKMKFMSLKPTGVTFSAVMEALSAKWGEPTVDQTTEERQNRFGTNAATTITQSAIWTHGTQTAILVHSNTVSHFGDYLPSEPETLYLTIGSGRTPTDLVVQDIRALVPPDPIDSKDAAGNAVKF